MSKSCIKAMYVIDGGYMDIDKGLMTANTDIGKPARMRSRTLKDFLVRFYHLTHIGLALSAATLLFGLAIREGK